MEDMPLSDTEASTKARGRLILLCLALLYLARLVIIGKLELAPDEAYYWYWAQHLDWSYFDHPPMVAYLIAPFTRLMGSTEFAVRLGALLCTLASLPFLFMTARCLFPGQTRMPWDLVLITNVILLFSAAAIVQTPDTPLLLFWSIALFCGAKIAAGGSMRWWYLWGVALGLGLVSKYNMILIVPCQGLFLLLSPGHRRQLLRKEPWLAGVLGLLIFSPVILWNWQHDWISFAFQLHHGFDAREHSALAKLLAFTGAQAGVITPLLFSAFVFYSYKALRMGLLKKDAGYLYLTVLSWPILLFFALSTAKGKVAAANWPAAAYLAGLILMYGVYSEHFRQIKGHRRFMAAGVALAAALTVVLHIHLIHPILPLPNGMDPTSQFHGWAVLGDKIQSSISGHPNAQGYFIMGDRDQRVAEAVFYTGNRYPGIHSKSPFIFLPDTSSLAGRNAVILEYRFGSNTLQKYGRFFQKVSDLGEHTFTYRNEEIEGLSVHLLLGESYRGNLYTAKSDKARY
jgi:4-amino-4-deoxy-L-arabinose transferase-like glycosyltransferase